MAIDYGTKRTGLAVSDPQRLIATPLETVPTGKLFGYLETYFARENVAVVVVGEPTDEEGRPAAVEQHIRGFVRKLARRYPALQILRRDESLTSLEARQALLYSGLGRKKRAEKSRVDITAATLLLQAYLEEG
jgi:putative Holliday junction resolvase